MASCRRAQVSSLLVLDASRRSADDADRYGRHCRAVGLEHRSDADRVGLPGHARVHRGHVRPVLRHPESQPGRLPDRHQAVRRNGDGSLAALRRASRTDGGHVRVVRSVHHHVRANGLRDGWSGTHVRAILTPCEARPLPHGSPARCPCYVDRPMTGRSCSELAPHTT